MTRTLAHNYLGVTYQIKLRTIANSDMSSIVIWRDGTALTGTSFVGAMGNKEAKIMAERMIEEYYDSIWDLVGEEDISGRCGSGLCY